MIVSLSFPTLPRPPTPKPTLPYSYFPAFPLAERTVTELIFAERDRSNDLLCYVLCARISKTQLSTLRVEWCLKGLGYKSNRINKEQSRATQD